MFDPNRVWTDEEKQELFNKEAPIFSIANKYTLEDLLKENPDYKIKMLEEIKSRGPKLYKCSECGKTMPDSNMEIHKKYCKKKENGETNRIQGDSSS